MVSHVIVLFTWVALVLRELVEFRVAGALRRLVERGPRRLQQRAQHVEVLQVAQEPDAALARLLHRVGAQPLAPHVLLAVALRDRPQALDVAVVLARQGPTDVDGVGVLTVAGGDLPQRVDEGLLGVVREPHEGGDVPGHQRFTSARVAPALLTRTAPVLNIGCFDVGSHQPTRRRCGP